MAPKRSKANSTLLGELILAMSAAPPGNGYTIAEIVRLLNHRQGASTRRGMAQDALLNLQIDRDLRDGISAGLFTMQNGRYTFMPNDTITEEEPNTSGTKDRHRSKRSHSRSASEDESDQESTGKSRSRTKYSERSRKKRKRSESSSSSASSSSSTRSDSEEKAQQPPRPSKQPKSGPSKTPQPTEHRLSAAPDSKKILKQRKSNRYLPGKKMDEILERNNESEDENYTNHNMFKQPRKRNRDLPEKQMDELLELKNENADVNNETADVNNESHKIFKQTRKCNRDLPGTPMDELLELHNESAGVNIESADINNESVDINSESADVNNESSDVDKKDPECNNPDCICTLLQKRKEASAEEELESEPGQIGRMHDYIA